MNISFGPFSANNMAAPTRYGALPLHFQLDEHAVKAGLVENLNVTHERGKQRRGGAIEGEGKHEESEGKRMSGW